MQWNFGQDTIWNCVRTISMRCNWILAKAQSGKSQNNFDEMHWNFGQDTVWSCLRLIPMRCKGISAKTQFGIVLEKLQRDAIDFGLRQNLELS